MLVSIIGGGPGGLYSAILLKKSFPTWEIKVYERNGPNDTFGFGVVFSDATLGRLEEADPESYQLIKKNFAYWSDIHTHFKGEKLVSTGHGFCGLARLTLLQILQGRCKELGVKIHYEHPVDTPETLAATSDFVIAADGVSSHVREHYTAEFTPVVDHRPNRFVWLGTTFPFDAFTFYFKENEHGLFRVHAYRYEENTSTFIVECTEETWRKASLDSSTEDETVRYLESLFSDELAGHSLIKNRSIWRQFPTVKCTHWHHENIVLLGDAVHTAHFSIGSGTKLAMEDAIDLAAAFRETTSVADALPLYEQKRRPEVERLQAAAQVSLEWFENTEQYLQMSPLQFTYSLLTRSLRVSHEKLRKRDSLFIKNIERTAGGHPLDQKFEFQGKQLHSRVLSPPGSPEFVLPIPGVQMRTNSLESVTVSGTDMGSISFPQPAAIRVLIDQQTKFEALISAAHRLPANLFILIPTASSFQRQALLWCDVLRNKYKVATGIGEIPSIDHATTAVAAGRVDFVELSDRSASSFEQQVL